METGLELLGRLKLGREEFCQRLLTQLILGAPYPKWNTRSQVAPRGLAFLRRLDTMCWGSSSWPDAFDFVDEFDLPARSEAEAGGAPDYACVWPQRLWMIELKTEVGSHRRDQLPLYIELGGHHHPGKQIDLTYLTPTMTTPTVSSFGGSRFAHLTWSEAMDVAHEIWSDSPSQEDRSLLAWLSMALEGIGSDWTLWRTQKLDASTGVDHGRSLGSSRAALEEAQLLAEATAADGEQRALDYVASGLSGLQDLRVELRDRLAGFPVGDARRHVRPWLWSSATSGGMPLTGSGESLGYELRVSRYAKPTQ